MGRGKAWGIREQAGTEQCWRGEWGWMGSLVPEQWRAPGKQDGSGKSIRDCRAEVDWRRGPGQGGSWEGRKVDLQDVCFGQSGLHQRGASAGTEYVGGAEEQEACVRSHGLSLLLWG